MPSKPPDAKAAPAVSALPSVGFDPSNAASKLLGPYVCALHLPPHIRTLICSSSYSISGSVSAVVASGRCIAASTSRPVARWLSSAFLWTMYRRMNWLELRLANLSEHLLFTCLTICHQSEIQLLKKLKHPNIVKYIDTIRTEHNLNIIIEYVENGSLANIVKKFGYASYWSPYGVYRLSSSSNVQRIPPRNSGGNLHFTGTFSLFSYALQNLTEDLYSIETRFLKDWTISTHKELSTETSKVRHLP